MDSTWENNEYNDEFAEDFRECPNSGIGNSSGGRYIKKKFTHDHIELDCSVHITENGIQMYGIFCGFNGGPEVAKFVMNRMVYEIFRDKPINVNMEPMQIKDALRVKFNTVNMLYLQMMDDDLTEHCLLKDDFEKNRDRISILERKLRQGSMALVLLRVGNDLYLLNCGTSLAVVVQDDQNVPVFQLNERVHEFEDESEKIRLKEFDTEVVYRPTRAVGDFFRSILYEDDLAKGPPIISDPDIYHWQIEESWKYIVLVSDGVVQNLRECNVEDIPKEILENLQLSPISERSTAQGLVDTFGSKHYDAYSRDNFNESMSSHREEMTVIFVRLRNSIDINSLDYQNSSMDLTPPIINPGPLIPYVDILDLDSACTYELQKFFQY